MTQNLKVKQGEVIVFTRGVYSDFGLDAFLVFTKDANLKELAQQYFNGKEQYSGDAELSSFSAKLIADGYAMPVSYREIHLGEYSAFDGEFGIEYKDED